jgi:branched-chain amino acid aminotransferase
MAESTFYINGRYVDESQAAVSILDHGFLYGDGIFEAFRVYDGKIFQLDAHINRLFDSAKIIDLKIPMDKEAFKKIVIETVRRSEFKDCYVRPQVTRGVGTLGHDPASCKQPTVIVYVTPTPQLKKEKSIRIIVSGYRRPPAYILPPESKTIQYMNNILAKMEAKQKGADDAILLDARGFVSEGCAWNVFVIKDDHVSSPSITSSILPGITRNVVIRLLNEADINVEERDVSLSELFTADEVFGTGSGSGISPVIEINGRVIGSGEPGFLTLKLDSMFKEFTASHGTPV